MAADGSAWRSVVFASWRPGKALAGALLFAAFDALQLRLQQASGAKLPYQIYLMLPYALSILALVVMARRAAYPQALMKPYRKGEAMTTTPSASRAIRSRRAQCDAAGRPRRHGHRGPRRPDRGPRAAWRSSTPCRAATELDARGQLVTPPFVDAHFHMDSTLSYGLPRVNASERCSKASRCGAS